MRNLIILLLIIIFSSCERECKLKPIDKNTFDLNKINEKYYLISDKNEIDSLLLIDKVDVYEKTSFKSPMNIRECQHLKSYTVEFQNNQIQVYLTKRENGILELNVISQCFISVDDINVIPAEMENNEFIFKRTSCGLGESNIEQIILDGYKIKTIKTVDKKTWNLNK